MTDEPKFQRGVQVRILIGIHNGKVCRVLSRTKDPQWDCWRYHVEDCKSRGRHNCYEYELGSI